jgi:hypothetical protein
VARIPTSKSWRLETLWRELLRLYPRLAESTLGVAQLEAGYRINLDGQRFVTDPQTPISGGQCVLILSADAGG